MIDRHNRETVDHAISEGDEVVTIQETSIEELVNGGEPLTEFGEEQRYIIDVAMHETPFHITVKTLVKMHDQLWLDVCRFIDELGHHLGHPKGEDVVLAMMAGKASDYSTHLAISYTEPRYVYELSSDGNYRKNEDTKLPSLYEAASDLCPICLLEKHRITP